MKGAWWLRGTWFESQTTGPQTTNLALVDPYKLSLNAPGCYHIPRWWSPWIRKKRSHHILFWLVVSHIFWNFHPETWGNDPILTSICFWWVGSTTNQFWILKKWCSFRYRLKATQAASEIYHGGGFDLIYWAPVPDNKGTPRVFQRGWNHQLQLNILSIPPETNMTGWKIHHEWRCISYWTWGFSMCTVINDQFSIIICWGSQAKIQRQRACGVVSKEGFGFYWSSEKTQRLMQPIWLNYHSEI